MKESKCARAARPIAPKSVWESNAKNAAAISGAAIASLGLIIVVFGIRPDLMDADVALIVTAKLAFSLMAVGLSSIFLTKLTHADGAHRSTLVLMSLPLLGAMALATLGMFADPNWDAMIRGDRWIRCLVSVPIMTVLPFITIMCAVRAASPADAARTGALVGLVSSAVSVTAYALHCPLDPAPFVALWFGGTSFLCMLSGAMLGPRLLRRRNLAHQTADLATPARRVRGTNY